MEVFMFRIATDYFIHKEAENYFLAYQFYKKKKTDNFLQHLRFDAARSVCQLIEQWLRKRYHFTEFTKSLMKPNIYLYKYRINASTLFWKKNPKAFTRYHIERVEASYATKNIRFYKINKSLSFYSTTLSVLSSVGTLYYLILQISYYPLKTI